MIEESIIKTTECTFVSVRKFLDEEILYSLLYKDLKVMSLKFVSSMISRLSDTLPSIVIPSDVACYIQSHPNMQTFSGRIAPVFIGDFQNCIKDFFVYFFSCQCFQSILQVGPDYVLKYSKHEDATDGFDLLEVECDNSFTLVNDKYWLILSIKDIYLEVNYYARNMEIKTSSILQLLINRIFRMVRKVNQKALLHELNESRRARY